MNSPFSVYRTELTKTQLEEYFVQPHFINDITDNKPVFIIGERGSGKTTLLKYLSYDFNNNVDKWLNTNYEYLGVYWRFDLNTITAFKGDFLKIEEWESFFGHYMSTVFCNELCKIVLDLKKNVKFSFEEKVCEAVWENLFDKDIEKPSNFESLLKTLNRVILDTISFIRNHEIDKKPRQSNVGQTYKIFCNELGKEEVFKNATFYFLLDEYESLLEYQQKVINTFLKYSDQTHTFKICMRPKGFKTNDTLGGEFIREKDDYKVIDFTEKLKTEGRFKQFAKEVCKKRFEIFYQKHHPEKILSEEMLDIDKYLAQITIDDEFKIITKNKKSKWFPKYNAQINKMIESSLPNNSNTVSIKEEITKLVADDAFKIRLVLFLLEKGYDVHEIINSLQNEALGYKSWVHNYKIPILHLLCFETQTKKEMSGFDTIVDISGGVIRYFLELCDEIFLHAINNGFDFNKLEPIDINIQREAINYVSRKRFEQLNTIPKYGDNIKNFVLCIGKIFNIYHRDRRISKIEVNHFSINHSHSVNAANKIELNRIINECVIWGILTERKSTKQKSKFDITEGDIDYFLHPIYSPYFGISWRKKHKTRFSETEIFSFFFDNMTKCQDIIKEKINLVSLNIPAISSVDTLEQLSLFEVEEEA